jgi:hypothetical protein
MLGVMDILLRKRIFFSGNSKEKEDTGFRGYQEFYCEGQNVNDHNVREEHGFVIMKENRISRFFANYNMFF